MNKYQTYERKQPPRRNEPHPVWRGIGCLIMLIVPAIAFAISSILVELAPTYGIQLPVEWLGPPMMPELLFRVPGLVSILYWIQSLNNLYAILIIAFVVAVLLAGVVALGYAIIYRMIGPPRYSPLDAPDINVKVKRYKR